MKRVSKFVDGKNNFEEKVNKALEEIGDAEIISIKYNTVISSYSGFIHHSVLFIYIEPYINPVK